MQEEGGLRLIEPTKYLNVVVAPLADTVSGYSALPWFPEELDGIVIDYSYFGTVQNSYPFNEGKTLLHLIANSFWVNSLWTNGKCEDDNLIDTPIHNAPNRGCPEYLHVSACFENRVELTFNYLDNSDDRCLKSFTKSQVSRMRKVLKVLRKGWISEGESVCGNEGLHQQANSAKNRPNKVLNELKVPPQLQIRPNPANGAIEIQVQNTSDLSEKEGQIRIFTASGKAIYTRSFSLDGILTIDSSVWSPGLYFVKSKIGNSIQTQTLAIAR